MQKDENCVFCKIVAGEIPSFKVAESANTMAILDAHPTNIGHVLVIPKEHYKNIYETPENIAGELMKEAKILAPAVKKAMGAEGINLIMNNDRAAGQVVFHTHLHIIPRHEEDGYRLWPSKRDYNPGEADEVLKKIQSSLAE